MQTIEMTSSEIFRTWDPDTFSIFELIEDDLLSIFTVINGLSDQGSLHVARTEFQFLIDKCSDEAIKKLFRNARCSKVRLDIDDGQKGGS